MLKTARNYLELCRLHIWGFGVQCVLGALTVVGDALTVAQFVPLFAVNAITIAWSFVHNDYSDYELDIHAPDLARRVLVRGDISRQAALRAAIVLFGTSAIITYLSWPGLMPIGILMLIALLIVLYNRYSKMFLGADFVFATAGSLLCVLGAVAIIPTHDLRLLPALTWIVFAISFIDHLNFNAVLGGVKDALSDKKQGCDTIACRNIEVDDDGCMRISVGFKAMALLGSLLIIALVFLPFTVFSYPSNPWQIGLLIVFSGLTLFHTYEFVNMERHDRDIIAQVARKREMASKSLLVCMLAIWIGVSWTIFLLVIPMLFFVIFSVVMYGHPFRLPAEY